MQQSKLRWTRSEALANVIATEFIDLPLADSEGELENEMKGKTGKLCPAIMGIFISYGYMVNYEDGDIPHNVLLSILFYKKLRFVCIY